MSELELADLDGGAVHPVLVSGADFMKPFRPTFTDKT
jgi:hypothetical protein